MSERGPAGPARRPAPAPSVQRNAIRIGRVPRNGPGSNRATSRLSIYRHLGSRSRSTQDRLRALVSLHRPQEREALLGYADYLAGCNGAPPTRDPELDVKLRAITDALRQIRPGRLQVVAERWDYDLELPTDPRASATLRAALDATASPYAPGDVWESRGVSFVTNNPGHAAEYAFVDDMAGVRMAIETITVAPVWLGKTLLADAYEGLLPPGHRAVVYEVPAPWAAFLVPIPPVPPCRGPRHRQPCCSRRRHV